MICRDAISGTDMRITRTSTFLSAENGVFFQHSFVVTEVQSTIISLVTFTSSICSIM